MAIEANLANATTASHVARSLERHKRSRLGEYRTSFIESSLRQRDADTAERQKRRDAELKKQAASPWKYMGRSTSSSL